MWVLGLNICKDNKGYSAILIPIILSLILCFVALVFDFGRVLILKHQLQSSADSAALAGASMVKVEFATDSNGAFQFDSNVISIVEDKALSEADKMFDKNMDELKLESKGIQILETKGEVVQSQAFKYHIRARIPMFLSVNFLKTKEQEDITIVSEAKPT